MHSVDTCTNSKDIAQVGELPPCLMGNMFAEECLGIERKDVVRKETLATHVTRLTSNPISNEAHSAVPEVHGSDASKKFSVDHSHEALHQQSTETSSRSSAFACIAVMRGFKFSNPT